MKRSHPRQLLKLMTLGLIISASSGVFQATSAAAAPRSTAQQIQSSTPQPTAAGNPCSTNKNTKACRDWILGHPKPPIRPKG